MDDRNGSTTHFHPFLEQSVGGEYNRSEEWAPPRDWSVSAGTVLRGCLGLVAAVGIVAAMFALRRIVPFLGSAGHRLGGSDLKRHSQLVASSSVCDVLHCAVCSPLVIFRKMSDFDMAWSWSDAIFRTIGCSHLLVLVFKVAQNLSASSSSKEGGEEEGEEEEEEEEEDEDEEDCGVGGGMVRPRKSRGSGSDGSTFERTLEVFVLWLVGIFVVSMVFMLCQALKYFASFEGSDRFLLLGVLTIAHLLPLSLLSFHGFHLRRLRLGVCRSNGNGNGNGDGDGDAGMELGSGTSTKRPPAVGRDLWKTSDDSFAMFAPLRAATVKDKTNLSTLSLAGSFSRRQRRCSWNSFRKKSSTRSRNHGSGGGGGGGGRISPRLDRHPSLRYSIKKRRSSSLVELNELDARYNKQQDKQQIDPQQQQQQQQLQQHKEEPTRTSQFLTVSSPQRSCRTQKSVEVAATTTTAAAAAAAAADEKPKINKSKRRRTRRFGSRVSAGSGNESGKSSRSSSRSDRSSSSGRLERHPSLKFSTRRSSRIRLSHQDVADETSTWRGRCSDVESGKTKRKKKRTKNGRYFPGSGSHEVLNQTRSFKVVHGERNRFGGSMRMARVVAVLAADGKKSTWRIGTTRNNTILSRSHSHVDHKKLMEFERHPSLRYSTHKISRHNETSRILQADSKACVVACHSSKNLLIPECSRQMKTADDSTARKANHPSIKGNVHRASCTRRANATVENRQEKLLLVQSRSYSTLRPRHSDLDRTHSCRGSFVFKSEGNSTLRPPKSGSVRNRLSDDVGAEVDNERTEELPVTEATGKGNVRPTALEGVVLSTVILNVPVAFFFLMALFIFNPFETSDLLVTLKMVALCVSYAGAGVRSFLVCRSLKVNRK